MPKWHNSIQVIGNERIRKQKEHCRAAEVGSGTFLSARSMICDLCNAAIAGSPGFLLGTKEVVTSKDCWKLYLSSILSDKVMMATDVSKSLSGLVGQMACSDTPWAICDSCTVNLEWAGFPLPSPTRAIAPRGHALCRSTKLMVFEVMDDVGMVAALAAAKAAAIEMGLHPAGQPLQMKVVATAPSPTQPPEPERCA